MNRIFFFHSTLYKIFSNTIMYHSIGHNGLTAAAYLAKNGLKTCVLERRSVIGGAAVTEEIIEGFKFSRASYLLSLLRPQIYDELELKVILTVLLDPSDFYAVNFYAITEIRSRIFPTVTVVVYTFTKVSMENEHDEISYIRLEHTLRLRRDCKILQPRCESERIRCVKLFFFSQNLPIVNVVFCNSQKYFEFHKKLQKFVDCIEPLMDVSPHTLQQLFNNESSTLAKLKIISRSKSVRNMRESRGFQIFSSGFRVVSQNLSIFQ